MNDIPDRIRKQVLIEAPRERVWRAISEADRFGAWFGVAFEGQFSAGRTMKGTIVPTRVDPEVAKLQEPHRGTPFEFTVERIEPLSYIAFRWHPFAIDRDHDYSGEPTTLIEFELEDADGGTLLTVTESGFDRIPLARRAAAFKANEGGWEKQTMLVAKYLATTE